MSFDGFGARFLQCPATSLQGGNRSKVGLVVHSADPPFLKVARHAARRRACVPALGIRTCLVIVGSVRLPTKRAGTTCPFLCHRPSSLGRRLRHSRSGHCRSSSLGHCRPASPGTSGYSNQVESPRRAVTAHSLGRVEGRMRPTSPRAGWQTLAGVAVASWSSWSELRRASRAAPKALRP
jgi:hypothetical protein